MIRTTLGCLSLVLLPSCLDLKPDRAPVVRYFTIAQHGAASSARATGTTKPLTPLLRLGRVHSADGINDRLIRRQSAFEISYDDQVRWVEPPEMVLLHALEAELFRRSGFVRDDSAARRLDVELVQFEEALGARREGVVALVILLTDEGGGPPLERRIEARQIITGGEDPALTAQALSAAMDSAMAELVDLLATR